MTNKPRSNGLTGKPSNNKGKKFRPDTTYLTLRIPVTLREALEAEATKKGLSLNKLATAKLEARVAVRSADSLK